MTNEIESPDSSPKPKPLFCVGIGASAGGLEAIQSFIKNMPVDSGLSFIVIQHLSPDYKSMMDELLSKVTDIPVQVVNDGMEVEPNNIYLIPPRKNLSIFHRKLLLSPQDRTSMTVNLPIDLFFHSLAEDQGRNAIAIVLSGTGSDGTRGCRAIKEAGGLVMVQSEASAKFAGMPKSVVSNGLADFVLAVEEMPKQLLRYVNHPLASKTQIQEPVAAEKGALAKIFSMLRAKSKIDFTFYKPPTITRRIERRMTINQVSTLDEYVEFLNAHPTELKVLYRELLIGVTNFFRDAEVFETMHEKLLRKYIQNLQDDQLRIWVAGCSTGEEAYTYGMLCQDICEKLGRKIDIKIFATDIDQDALTKASQGLYSEVVISDIPSTLFNKFFQPSGESYQICRTIRETVVFARHDIIKDPPFTNIDLVSCRNLLIYLQPVLQRRIFDGFNFSLKPDGILVLGTSETLGDAEHYFDTLDTKWKIYKSRGNRKPLLQSERFSTPDPLTMLADPSRLTRHRQDSRGLDDSRILESFIESLSGSHIPFAIIINESHELIRVVGDPKKYLRQFSGKVSTDISKNLVKDLTIPVITGLAKVFKTKTEVNFTSVRINHDGGNIKVNLSIKPLIIHRSQPLLAAVLISEVEENIDAVGAIKKNTIKYDVDEEIYQRISDLEQELQFTRENLQATIEELETSNEELQATNEELLASNEELQSTNEELQSVNEELYTVNAEYQGKIVELSEVNADMDNFMASSMLIAIFLDEGMRLRKFTRNAKIVFNILEQDVGRPFEHISYRLKSIDLLKSAQKVFASGHEMVAQVQSVDGDWYDLRIRPYMLSQDMRSGIVVLLHEINSLKAAQDDLLMAIKRKQMAQTLTNSGTWDWSFAEGTMVWSENFVEMLDLPRDMTKHTLEAFMQRVHPADRVSLKQRLDASVERSEPYHVEHRVVLPDGSVQWVEQRGALIFDENNQPVRMLGVIHVITDRKEKESKDAQVMLRYKLMLSSISEAVFGLDQDGKVIFANPSACALLGWTEPQMLGRYQHEFLEHRRPDGAICDLANCEVYAHAQTSSCGKELCFVHQVMREGKQVSVDNRTAICRDGRRIQVSCTVSPVHDGAAQLGAIIVFHGYHAE